MCPSPLWRKRNPFMDYVGLLWVGGNMTIPRTSCFLTALMLSGDYRPLRLVLHLRWHIWVTPIGDSLWCTCRDGITAEIGNQTVNSGLHYLSGKRRNCEITHMYPRQMLLVNKLQELRLLWSICELSSWKSRNFNQAQRHNIGHMDLKFAKPHFLITFVNYFLTAVQLLGNFGLTSL